MPLTPEDVQNKRFSTVRFKEGYDEEEVDAFLDEVEAELRRLLGENTDLRSSPAAEAPPIAAAPTPAPVAQPLRLPVAPKTDESRSVSECSQLRASVRSVRRAPLRTLSACPTRPTPSARRRTGSPRSPRPSRRRPTGGPPSARRLFVSTRPACRRRSRHPGPRCSAGRCRRPTSFAQSAGRIDRAP